MPIDHNRSTKHISRYEGMTLMKGLRARSKQQVVPQNPFEAPSTQKKSPPVNAEPAKQSTPQYPEYIKPDTLWMSHICLDGNPRPCATYMDIMDIGWEIVVATQNGKPPYLSQNQDQFYEYTMDLQLQEVERVYQAQEMLDQSQQTSPASHPDTDTSAFIDHHKNEATQFTEDALAGIENAETPQVQVPVPTQAAATLPKMASKGPTQTNTEVKRPVMHPTVPTPAATTVSPQPVPPVQVPPQTVASLNDPNDPSPSSISESNDSWTKVSGMKRVKGRAKWYMNQLRDTGMSEEQIKVVMKDIKDAKGREQKARVEAMYLKYARENEGNFPRQDDSQESEARNDELLQADSNDTEISGQRPKDLSEDMNKQSSSKKGGRSGNGKNRQGKPDFS